MSKAAGFFGRNACRGDSRPRGLAFRQVRRCGFLAACAADAAAANRRGGYGRAGRQDVLGAVGRTRRRCAGRLFGDSFDRLSRPRGMAESPAGRLERRLHSGGRIARPIFGRTRGLPGRQGARDSQRHRPGAISSALARPTVAGRVVPRTGRADRRHHRGVAAGEESRVVSLCGGVGPQGVARRKVSDSRRRAGARQARIAGAEPGRRRGR